jgi:hypothetical protein
LALSGSEAPPALLVLNFSGVRQVWHVPKLRTISGEILSLVEPVFTNIKMYYYSSEGLAPLTAWRTGSNLADPPLSLAVCKTKCCCSSRCYFSTSNDEPDNPQILIAGYIIFCIYKPFSCTELFGFDRVSHSL